MISINVSIVETKTTRYNAQMDLTDLSGTYPFVQTFKRTHECCINCLNRVISIEFLEYYTFFILKAIIYD